MKFKIDENLPLEAATALRDAGFDVETVWDEALSGAADEIIAARVQHETRVLVTLDLDLDFANIQAYPPDRFAGIVVLRSKTQDKPTFGARQKITVSRIAAYGRTLTPAGLQPRWASCRKIAERG